MVRMASGRSFAPRRSVVPTGSRRRPAVPPVNPDLLTTGAPGPPRTRPRRTFCQAECRVGCAFGWLRSRCRAALQQCKEEPRPAAQLPCPATDLPSRRRPAGDADLCRPAIIASAGIEGNNISAGTGFACQASWTVCLRRASMTMLWRTRCTNSTRQWSECVRHVNASPRRATTSLRSGGRWSMTRTLSACDERGSASTRRTAAGSTPSATTPSIRPRTIDPKKSQVTA